MTVLIVAHGHPSFNKGGAEIASYRLFEALRHCEDWKDSGFLAAAPDDSMLKPGCQVLGLSESEWLLKRSSDPLLHDTMVNLTSGVHGFLYEAISHLNPKIIHIHHYVHIGFDLIHALKRWFPKAKFVLTLHEYWGICPFEGRLLTSSGQFCSGPQPDNCVVCMGESLRIKLAVRRLRVQHYFSKIDHFISPSYFLKQRYIDWGLNPKQISVVENLLPTAEHPALSIRPVEFSSTLTIGFFGQVNPWKGVDLILSAVAMARRLSPHLVLEIHGCSLRDLEPEHSAHPLFAAELKRKVEQLGSEGVRLCGCYEPGQLSQRMAGVDVVVMGSIWFENAPMVIQEAFLNGLPVIAPRLGGMAEKIQEGLSGLLFEPCDSSDLANILTRVCREPELLAGMSRYVQAMPLKGTRALEQHMRIYNRLLKARPINELNDIEIKYSEQDLLDVSLSDVDPKLLADLRCNFEPLGANCELGFLMGRLEIQRSSLFRWLFTPLAGLEFVLQDREHLRRIFDDPVAVSDPVMASDMVVDRQSGIFFHAAELRSELEAASTDAALLDELYCGDSFLDQKAKYSYLVDKFMAAVLHPDTLHVFSDFHQELTEESMYRIHDYLKGLGKPIGSRLLFVRVAEDGVSVNSVKSLGGGLQIGWIHRLAPGEHADRIDLNSWLQLLHQSRNLN